MNKLEQRVFQYLPYKAYCSSDKTASLIRNQKHAVCFPYIQINSPIQCAWLVFDCDHTDTLIYERAGLPMPNYIAVSPDSGKFHMAYAISPVYTSENARAKPLAYLAAIQRTYTELLQADKGYAGLMTKNPLHNDWRVIVLHYAQYDLGDLEDAVRGPLLPKPAKGCTSGYGRNCDLFDELRYYAYAHVKNATSNDSWFEHLLSVAESINAGFVPPMSYPEVRGIAKSVSKWTWQRRDSIRVKERKLKLDESQPLETRQSVGAHYAATVKAEATLTKLRLSYECLLAEGKKATQKAVQEHSGLGIATVKRYWNQVKV
ncbi:replication initiation protein [Vibrio sp. 1409]|uniref:replication initiation protein n=1 Tax=unclassified Vibrio TaxID=2614977 RepID=UPI001CF47DC4|nr:replication initiation protein [Vibrio sp. 1408]MCA6722196.1 replication initiation protein [Vibrio alginolyticus]MDW2260812.1 replication initiation protein [Vibrio sp. 1409]MDW3054180.1 replication initiation protein [Vibrio sp. 1408]